MKSPFEMKAIFFLFLARVCSRQGPSCKKARLSQEANFKQSITNIKNHFPGMKEKWLVRSLNRQIVRLQTTNLQERESAAIEELENIQRLYGTSEGFSELMASDENLAQRFNQLLVTVKKSLLKMYDKTMGLETTDKTLTETLRKLVLLTGTDDLAEIEEMSIKPLQEEIKRILGSDNPGLD